MWLFSSLFFDPPRMADPRKQPTVLWAQRMECVFATVAEPEARDVCVRIVGGAAPTLSIEFDVPAAAPGAAPTAYRTVLPLFGDVAPEQSAWCRSQRGHIEIRIRKRPAGGDSGGGESKGKDSRSFWCWWSRLTADKRPAQVQIDWARWRDEDDDEGDDSGGDFGGSRAPGGGNDGSDAGGGGAGGLSGRAGAAFNALGFEYGSERHSEMLSLARMLESSQRAAAAAGASGAGASFSGIGGAGLSDGPLAGLAMDAVPAFGSLREAAAAPQPPAGAESDGSDGDYADMPPLEPPS